MGGLFCIGLWCHWTEQNKRANYVESVKLNSNDTSLQKGYFHSTTSIHNFLIGFLRARQKRALWGLSGGGLPPRRTGRFLLALIVVAPSAACHAVDRGLSGAVLPVVLVATPTSCWGPATMRKQNKLSLAAYYTFNIQVLNSKWKTHFSAPYASASHRHYILLLICDIFYFNQGIDISKSIFCV